jgi:peptidoglycan/LPS O-acetylase OafA/YrhL
MTTVEHRPAAARGKARNAFGALPRLTSTRAFAALAIFVFHLHHDRVLGASVFPFAYSLLGYFFLLSGFVLAWSTSPSLPTRRYYRRRAARIWPNHLVMVVIALLVPVTPHRHPSVLAVTSNVFLVQSWFPKGDVVFGLNAGEWSLSVEVAFYAALPLLLPLLRRLSARQRWAVAWGALFLDAAVVLAAAQIGGNVATGAYTQPLLRAGEFLLGVVAALEMRRGWRLPAWVRYPGAGGCALIAFLVPHPLPSLNPLLAPMWLLLIVGWAQADIEQRRGMLTWTPLVYAGQLAFAFYLVHDLVILNLAYWLHFHVATLCAVMLVTSVGLAVAIHHAVEQPMQRLLSGRSGPPQAADSESATRS